VIFLVFHLYRQNYLLHLLPQQHHYFELLQHHHHHLFLLLHHPQKEKYQFHLLHQLIH
jgi:hypothetical protein